MNVRKKVVMIDFMGAKIIHTSCDDTEGDDRGADDTTRCDDKLRLMTNKFDDRFAERNPRSGHPERSSRRVIPQGHPAGSSRRVIHGVVITRRVSFTKWSSQRVVSLFQFPNQRLKILLRPNV